MFRSLSSPFSFLCPRRRGRKETGAIKRSISKMKPRRDSRSKSKVKPQQLALRIPKRKFVYPLDFCKASPKSWILDQPVRWCYRFSVSPTGDWIAMATSTAFSMLGTRFSVYTNQGEGGREMTNRDKNQNKWFTKKFEGSGTCCALFQQPNSPHPWLLVGRPSDKPKVEVLHGGKDRDFKHPALVTLFGTEGPVESICTSNSVFAVGASPISLFSLETGSKIYQNNFVKSREIGLTSKYFFHIQHYGKTLKMSSHDGEPFCSLKLEDNLARFAVKEDRIFIRYCLEDKVHVFDLSGQHLGQFHGGSPNLAMFACPASSKFYTLSENRESATFSRDFASEIKLWDIWNARRWVQSGFRHRAVGNVFHL